MITPEAPEVPKQESLIEYPSPLSLMSPTSLTLPLTYPPSNCVKAAAANTRVSPSPLLPPAGSNSTSCTAH